MTKFISYKGWEVTSLENRWIKIYIAPHLGGRIIQLEMDGFEFFFINSLLAGKTRDSTRLGENGTWLNFGGEKIWPAPQGWDSPEQWAGPPDPVLDSGEYSVIRTTENGVTLISPFDNQTGLQIGKEIFLSENCSGVIVRATFYNKSEVPRKWSVWPVIQMNCSGDGIENQYRIVCPVNLKSKFSKGYRIMHGLVNNPQFKVRPQGYLVVNYQYLVGKVGLDTHSNWSAFIDTKSGKVFVLMFQNMEDKPYPEDTCVQIWTSGKGNIYSRKVIKEYKNDKALNPPYMEMELLSPLQEIPPGKSIQFQYRMLTCTIPENSEVMSVNPFGVIAFPLQFSATDAIITINGKYGVFRNGFIKLRIKANEKISELYMEKVSPFNGIALEFKMNTTEILIEKGTLLSVDFFDQERGFIGEIDKTTVDICN